MLQIMKAGYKEWTESIQHVSECTRGDKMGVIYKKKMSVHPGGLKKLLLASPLLFSPHASLTH